MKLKFIVVAQLGELSLNYFQIRLWILESQLEKIYEGVFQWTFTHSEIGGEFFSPWSRSFVSWQGRYVWPGCSKQTVRGSPAPTVSDRFRNRSFGSQACSLLNQIKPIGFCDTNYGLWKLASLPPGAEIASLPSYGFCSSFRISCNSRWSLSEPAPNLE